MEPNYRFVIDQARALAGPRGRMLDYGCGGGAVVMAARDEGLDMVGADIFYGGSEARRIAEERGLLGASVFEMVEGALPFPDASFDFVSANFVFEHVVDLKKALDEIRRVLKPGGAFLNLVPSIGVVREGHCGVPMAHWLNGWPAAQRLLLLAGREAGLGYFSEGKTPQKWAADFSDWLRNYTVYRRLSVLKREHLARFSAVSFDEPEYMGFRFDLRGRRGVGKLMRGALAPVARVVCRRLAGAVIVAR